MGHSLIAFVIVLGVLIFFHEFGHFIVARLFKVGVDTFSLGFGPKIYRKTVGETEYCLSAIPLGGYVKMVGEMPGEDLKPEDIGRSFTHKKLYQKMGIVAAGPAFNVLLAVVIFYLISQFYGLYLLRPVVGEVMEGKPAASAGIESGDVIRMIDEQPVEAWEDLARLISESGGRTVRVTIERRGQVVTRDVTPEKSPSTNLFGEETDRYLIGISASGEAFHKPLNPLEAFVEAFHQTWEITRLTFLSIGKIITGSLSAKTLGGPIMIAQMAGEQAQAGMVNLAFFIAMLSINLAIINLFPIPVLDGGHILFFAIEGLTGKGVSDTLREKANQFGVVLLVALMMFVFYNDILRIFNGG